jgi:hypothetical protein
MSASVLPGLWFSSFYAVQRKYEDASNYGSMEAGVTKNKARSTQVID